MSSVSLARILGLSTPQTIKALDRIAAAGVSDREEETGAMMNRRMVRDETLLQQRREWGHLGAPHGAKGGRPVKKETDDPVNTKTGIPVMEGVSKEPPNNPPSSSSSSSSSLNTGEIQKPLSAVADVPVKYTHTFNAFWFTSTRRGSKYEAFKAWKALSPSDELCAEISTGMQRWKESEQWQDETKQPHICRWLKRRGWEEIVPRSNGNGKRETDAEANLRAAKDFVSRKLAETVQRDLSDVREDAGRFPGTIG